MKKILILAAAVMIAAFTSCTSCSKSTPVEKDSVELVADNVFNVERIVSMDKEFMFANYSENYKWFETCVLMQDYLDEETDGTVVKISNVFQIQEEFENGADVHVVLTTHTPDTSTVEVKHGFWVEDQVINDEVIKITFAEAFEKIMATNCPKPHSKHCVLRKQVGPVDANPQYIFGNSHEAVFVDAVTGDVSLDNPTFPEGFKMPLGEWP